MSTPTMKPRHTQCSARGCSRARQGVYLCLIHLAGLPFAAAVGFAVSALLWLEARDL